MACYHPIPIHQDRPGAKVTLWPRSTKGRTTDLNTGAYNETGAIPCGTCIGCKSARAHHWAVRCQHEAEQYTNSIFLTLTYDDDHLPTAGYLDALAFQKFLKRARKRAQSHPDDLGCDQSRRLRYFGCGEYGETNGRPHYHAIIFNCKPPLHDSYRVGKDIFESNVFTELWPYGKNAWGPATPAAANYIAQYTLKKQRHNRGRERDSGYNDEGYVDEDGVWYPKPAPFLRMSLKPAIGATWLDKWKTDLQHGYLVHNGHKIPIPRTYLQRLKLQDPQYHEHITYKTDTHTRQHPKEDNNNPERRKAAEAIHKRRKQLTEQRNI